MQAMHFGVEHPFVIQYTCLQKLKYTTAVLKYCFLKETEVTCIA